MNPSVSRREMLKLMAALAGGMGLMGVQRLLTTAAAQSPAADMTPQAYLPFVSRPAATPTPTATPTQTPGTGPNVVHVHSLNATTWTGQPNYGNYVDQNTVYDMVDHGLMALTGQNTVSGAWQALLPSYQVGQGIAIKLNFNNSFDTSGRLIDAVPEPINALIRGLKLRGVAEDDIWLYQANKVIPDRFVDGCDYHGVRVYDNGSSGHRTTEFTSTAPSATVTFRPPSGVPMPPRIKVTDAVVNATYLINVPIMKQHGWSSTGVSLGFKNHWGTIDFPSSVHAYIFVEAPHRTASFNALVDVYRNPNILGKTVLTVGDGLFGAIAYDQPPTMWATFGNKPPNSLFFATDPVAFDCVLCDFVNAETNIDAGAPATDSYLQIAAQAGMGVYERGNPWGSGYQKIKYLKLER